MNFCVEEVHLKEETQRNQPAGKVSPETRLQQVLLAHLAADGQQCVQDHNGGDGGYSRHPGVIADDRPKREDQDRAGDHYGDEDQRPPQPVKWNDPQNLELKKVPWKDAFGN